MYLRVVEGLRYKHDLREGVKERRVWHSKNVFIVQLYTRNLLAWNQALDSMIIYMISAFYLVHHSKDLAFNYMVVV